MLRESFKVRVVIVETGPIGIISCQICLLIAQNISQNLLDPPLAVPQ